MADRPISWWIALILFISALLWFGLGSIVCSGPTQATEPWQKVYDNYDAPDVYDMIEYNNQLYIALGGVNSHAKVKRCDGNSWTQINTDGFGNLDNFKATSMATFNGLLYVGTDNFVTGAEVWAWNGTTWSQVNQDGFGYDFTLLECKALEVYNNSLYAVVSSNGGKFRVYKYAGSGTSWTQVDTDVWDSSNHVATCAISFDGYLWVATENTDTGSEVWRYNGANWTQVNADGFGNINTKWSYSFCVFNNQLYIGSGNNYTYSMVYRYNSGTNWSQVCSGGFGDTDNYGIKSMAEYDGKLFAGTATLNGCQVWSYNGTSWTKENQSGFGDSHNLEVTSMVGFNSYLYVGTYNSINAQVWKGTGEPQPTYQSNFYFAEGYTGPNFQEYLCIGNPNAQAATAEVTYMFNGGGTQEASYSISANSRTTVDVNSAVGAGKEVSIRVRSQTANLVAERPMYFNYQGKWTGGSDAVGATSPGKKWYFAEGTTRPEFEEWLTVQNPGSTTANLTFHYMIEGQGEAVYTGQVGPNSRATFKASDQVGLGKDISLMLESDQDVVAERPMYFSYQGLASHNWTGGHCVVGAESPAKEWYLAEGTTRDGFEEWLCLQNPNSFPITVNASYLLGPGQGGPVGKSYTVPAQQRLTVSVNKELGPEKDVSVKLTCDSDFLAERPMYFLYHGAWDGGHDVIGAGAPAQTWFLAEGYTGPNFEEWLCIENPGSADTNIEVTYYPGSGNPIVRSWTLAGNSRLTINVNQDAGPGLEISAKIKSQQPIIVERPMYFAYNGIWTGGHDVVGFAPK